MSIKQTDAPSGLEKYAPILSRLPGYPSGWLRFDLIAGLMTAAAVSPLTLAHAAIAGLAPKMRDSGLTDMRLKKVLSSKAKPLLRAFQPRRAWSLKVS